MRTFTIYDPATGEIAFVQTDRSGRMTLEAVQSSGATAIESTADIDTDWVNVDHNPPTVVPRPAFVGFDKTVIAADGDDAARIEGLPIPCTVVVDGDPIEVTDGVYELSSLTPATYVVEIEAFPYMPYRAEITAA